MSLASQVLKDTLLKIATARLGTWVRSDMCVAFVCAATDVLQKYNTLCCAIVAVQFLQCNYSIFKSACISISAKDFFPKICCHIFWEHSLHCLFDCCVTVFDG